MIKQEIILIIIGTLFLCIPTSAQNTDTTATSATLQRLDLRITILVGKRDSLDGMISPLSTKAEAMRKIRYDVSLDHMYPKKDRAIEVVGLVEEYRPAFLDEG